MSRLILTGVGELAANTRLVPDTETALGDEDVLLRMEAAPINPVDYLFAQNIYAVRPQLPSTLGAEGIGRVVKCGPAADPALTGRRVLVLGSYDQGVWADTVVVPARNVVAVPDDVDGLQLAMAGINPLTARVMLTRYADLRPGDWIGQTLGNSAVARCVSTLAKVAGVRTLSVVRSGRAAGQARAAGADLVLLDGPDLAGRVAAALGGDRLRLVLDGAGGTLPAALVAALEFGGTVVSYASVTGEPPAVPLGPLVFEEFAVRGLWVTNWFRHAPRAEVAKAVGEIVDLITRGVLAVPVDSTYPLERHADAFARDAAADRAGKVLFTFHHEKV
ncbi:zinc-dependent alcohol dehydrogenase family protein [Amycolatopsis sp. cmx-4-61]|uniref:zinc-dependent alcohol dehydrogenase family protein n=1 Tax=Amycolatopsis sp. cmx-4-61 TaxID=2790937 RepID=UPI00397A87B0